MAEIEARVDTRAFERAMREAPTRLFGAMSRRLGSFARGFLSKFKRGAFTGETGDRLRVRTGSLLRSFVIQNYGSDVNSLRILVGTPSVYARIHEVGGTVVPKKGKWLTVPLEAAKTGAGVTRASARHWANTFFRMTADGRLFLFEQRGEESVPLFRLVRSVTLKARLGFMRSFEGARPEFVRAVNAAVSEALAPRPAVAS